ncbi:MAG: 50S ribosomal protein L10 [Candidatus Saganbacteria bacterium]|nr:50S ribosomal protein L10 [Candidatus Saganbacteria bacterium]
MPGRTIVRPEKIKSVEAMKELADKSSTIIITNYKGMTVKQLTQLRCSLRSCGAQYKIVKNSVSVRALPKQNEILIKSIDESIAIVFGHEDVVGPTKQLVDFIAENEKPEILCGTLDNEFMTKEAIIQLSKLPSKNELIAKMLQCLNGPVYGFVNVLAGTMRKLLYALNAVKEKQESKGGES